MLDSLAKLDRELKRLDKLLSPQQQASSQSGVLRPDECQVDLTIEDILTGYEYAQIPASPLQRAICRGAQGLPLDDILTAEELQQYFGVRELPGKAPRFIELICGVRGGKSWMADCAAIHAALTADLSTLQLIEVPRFLIVAPKLETAEITFGILRRIIERSPVLSKLLDSDPTADTVVLRRPDGYRVEITVVAASRGGANVRGVWLVGFLLEEAAQFGAEARGAVVNAEQIFDAASTRLLPGCQGWIISSPYGPEGMLYEIWRQHFGQPGEYLVVQAPTRALNPSFPQADIDRVAERSPDTASREYGAEWVDAETAFLPGQLLDELTRDSPRARSPMRGAALAVGMDAATRGNAWTFVVVAKERHQDSDKIAILDAWESIGSSKVPLSPSQVLAEAATRLRAFGVRKVHCDGWSFDANQDHARSVGIELIQSSGSDAEAGYARLKTLVGSRDIELAPIDNLLLDLKALQQRGLSGSVKVTLPKQTTGRHCDYAPATSLAINAIGTPQPQPSVRRYISFEDRQCGIR